jgi:hypothetical protein
MVQNKYTDLSDSPEGLFIGECGEEKYTTNRANLGANYSIRIVSLVLVSPTNKRDKDRLRQSRLGVSPVLVS